MNRETRSRGALRPMLEALEGRVVLTTFHAANVAQLEADVAAVNNSTQSNTIVLAAGEYDLPGALQIQNASDLTIRAAALNTGTVTIVGGVHDRVIAIDGGNVTLNDLTITQGGSVALGGGIYSQNAVLTVKNSTVSDNLATLSGGGIYAQGGTLNVESSTVANNAASQGAASFGGGIAASGATVTVTSSTITNNSAFAINLSGQGSATAAGGGFYTQGGTLTITGTALTKNTVSAVTNGTLATSLGGVVSSTNTAITVSKSTITSNTLDTISTQATQTRGAAFSTVGGSLTITNSVMSGNTPTGLKNEFDHPGVTVVLKKVTVDGTKLPLNYTLKNTTPAISG